MKTEIEQETIEINSTVWANIISSDVVKNFCDSGSLPFAKIDPFVGKHSKRIDVFVGRRIRKKKVRLKNLKSLTIILDTNCEMVNGKMQSCCQTTTEAAIAIVMRHIEAAS